MTQQLSTSSWASGVGQAGALRGARHVLPLHVLLVVSCNCGLLEVTCTADLCHAGKARVPHVPSSARAAVLPHAVPVELLDLCIELLLAKAGVQLCLAGSLVISRPPGLQAVNLLLLYSSLLSMPLVVAGHLSI